MTDEPALLAAVLAHPDEDLPRLVYADWFSENGQPERGEFIRIQCELARLDSHEHGPNQRHSKDCHQCDRRAVLSIRERELFLADTPEGSWSVRGTEWFYQHLPWLEDEAMPPGQYHRPERGFIPGVTCSWNKWRDHAAIILARQPVRRVTLTTWPDVVSFLEFEWQSEHGRRMALGARWPGIEFTLPPEPQRPEFTRVFLIENPDLLPDLFSAVGFVNATPFAGMPAGNVILRDITVNWIDDGRGRAEAVYRFQVRGVPLAGDVYRHVNFDELIPPGGVELVERRTATWRGVTFPPQAMPDEVSADRHSRTDRL